ncbi:hypothetical protein RvVAR0630_34370 [Agrobacterium vitis]|nr:hypothetical protein RvVAR0630_34370 [Agrobacterium vitis]
MPRESVKFVSIDEAFSNQFAGTLEISRERRFSDAEIDEERSRANVDIIVGTILQH